MVNYISVNWGTSMGTQGSLMSTITKGQPVWSDPTKKLMQIAEKVNIFHDAKPPEHIVHHNPPCKSSSLQTPKIPIWSNTHPGYTWQKSQYRLQAPNPQHIATLGSTAKILVPDTTAPPRGLVESWPEDPGSKSRLHCFYISTNNYVSVKFSDWYNLSFIW